MVSLAYPIDRLKWALISSVILFHQWLPLLENLRIGPLFCPATSPRFWSFLRGGTGQGNPPPSPQCGDPPFPAGRGTHRWSRPQMTIIILSWLSYHQSSWPIFCFKFYTIVYLWYDDHGRTIHILLFHYCWNCYRVLKERLCQLAHLQVFSIRDYCLLWKQKNMKIFRI